MYSESMDSAGAARKTHGRQVMPSHYVKGLQGVPAQAPPPPPPPRQDTRSQETRSQISHPAAPPPPHQDARPQAPLTHMPLVAPRVKSQMPPVAPKNELLTPPKSQINTESNPMSSYRLNLEHSGHRKKNSTALDGQDKHVKRANIKVVNCSICSTTGLVEPATRFCFTCTNARCANCSGVHDRSAVSRTHVSVDISDEKMDAIMCQEHLDQCVVCFCTTCSRPACNLCIHQNHSEHAHVNFAVSSRQEDMRWDNIQPLLQQTRDMLLSEHEKYDSGKEADDIQKEEFRRMLHDHFQKQVLLLKRQQECLLEECDQILAQKAMDTTLGRGRVEKILQSVTGLEEQVNHIHCPLPGHNGIVLAQEFPAEELQLVIDMTRRIEPATSSSIQVSFLPGPDAHLGAVDTSGVAATSADDILEAGMKLDIDKDDLVVWKAMDQYVSYVTDIVAVNDNQDVACVTGFWPNKIVSCFDGRTGQEIQIPAYISKHSAGIVKLATNAEYCAILNKSSEDMCSLTMYQSDRHVCTIPCKDNVQPRAIAVATNGHVVMATIDEHVLCCYSKTSETIWKRDVPKTGSGGFELPVAITMTGLNQVVVADISGHQLHTYDPKGYHKTSFPSQADDNVNPVGVCVTPDNKLYVAFGKPLFVISKFDIDGQLLKHIFRVPFEPTRIQYLEKHNTLVIGTWGQGLCVYGIPGPP